MTSGSTERRWSILCNTRDNFSEYVRCRCVCGVTRSVRRRTIENGSSNGCGKCAAKNATEARIRRPVEPGAWFQDWKLIELARPRPRPGRPCYWIYWKCKCICGDMHEVSQRALVTATSHCCRLCAAYRRTLKKSSGQPNTL